MEEKDLLEYFWKRSKAYKTQRIILLAGNCICKQETSMKFVFLPRIRVFNQHETQIQSQ